MDPDSRWWERAACRGMDTEMFFPSRGANIEPAIEVCRTCPVRAECLEDQLTHRSVGADFGVWGGTSGRERARISSRRLARSA